MQSLSTIEEALDFIEGGHAHDGTLVRFDGELQTLTIEIEGPGYHGEITGEIARGLAVFQEEMYRAARFAVTGEDGRGSRLTNPDKEALELRIEVKKGCTLINIDLGKWSEGFLKVLGNMAPEVQIAIVVGAVAVVAAAWVGRHYITKHHEAKAAKQSSDAQQAVIDASLAANAAVVDRMAKIIENDQRIARFADASATGITEVATRAKDATYVKAGRMEFDQDDLAALKQRKPRGSPELIVETGKFRIIQVNGKTSPFKFTLSGQALPGEFTVDLDESDFSENKYARIWAAFKSQAQIELTVRAVLVGEKIKGPVLIDIEPSLEPQEE
ncbi:hypothetical protein [Delftia sp.]|uniref:hypothetical protein n=1 Tax=Delftia sp. TaxID=1886637 RepID=UPI0025802A61|nr:hypothetical protein [Delftia sp.]MPT54997.1 hypothetical protein [Delftia sp.]